MNCYTIYFKNSTQINFTGELLEVKRNGFGGFAGISWKNLTPDPMYINVDEISAIVQNEENK